MAARWRLRIQAQLSIRPGAALSILALREPQVVLLAELRMVVVAQVARVVAVVPETSTSLRANPLPAVAQAAQQVPVELAIQQEQASLEQLAAVGPRAQADAAAVPVLVEVEAVVADRAVRAVMVVPAVQAVTDFS